MFNFVSSQRTSLAASKGMKSFREGDLIKECAIKMAESFGEEKVAEKFKTVSLSHRTMARRVSDLSKHITSKLKSFMNKCSHFSIALDESIGVTLISVN